MRLIDAPVGLFMSKDGELCLKTEYIADWGVEAYIVSSGETFWGGAKTASERNELDVTPVDAVPVVRCKDCRRCDGFPEPDNIQPHEVGICKFNMRAVDSDDFCSYGERKNDARD